MAKNPKKTNGAKEHSEVTPTMSSSLGFSDFMSQMQVHHYKRRSTTLTDARSQVLLGLADVLQSNSVAVMHLADIANTAPNYNETQDLKTTPVE